MTAQPAISGQRNQGACQSNPQPQRLSEGRMDPARHAHGGRRAGRPATRLRRGMAPWPGGGTVSHRARWRLGHRRVLRLVASKARPVL